MIRRLPIVLLVLVSPLIAGCGGSDGSKMDLAQAEDEIRTEYQSQLGTKLVGETVKVTAVDCVKKSDREATCIAKVDGSAVAGSASVDVTFGDDGKFIWKADSSTLGLSEQAEYDIAEDESDAEQQARLDYIDECKAAGGDPGECVDAVGP